MANLILPERYELIDSVNFDAISSRPGKPGSHYKAFGQGSQSLARDVLDSMPYVDQQKMTVRAIISTATVDRVGDSLDPMGCNLRDYRLNPVCFWGHGLEGITLPIGRAEDDDGNLTIEITEDAVYGTTHFSKSLKAAEEIFDLIVEKIVRATSVRETPLQSRQYRDKTTGEIITQVPSWLLEEYSHCGIGVNPEAINKALTRKRRLSEPIYKSLLAQMPPAKRNGLGFTPETKVKENTMEDDQDTGGEDEGSEMKSANAPDKDGDGEGGKDPNKTPAEDIQGAEQADTNNDDPSTCPYGQQYLQAAHGKLKDAIDTIGQAYGPNEHPGVQEGMKKCMDSLKDELTNIQGMHEEFYPGAKTKLSATNDIEGGKAAGESSDADDADSKLKSFIQSGKSGYRMQGCITVLKSLATADNLTRGQRTQLLDLIDSQGRLLAEARAVSPKQRSTAKSATKQVSTDEQAKLDAAFARLSQNKS